MNRRPQREITVPIGNDEPDATPCRPLGWWYIPPTEHPAPGADMLDAYIIERIRRERDAEDTGRERLRIEIPRYERPPEDDRREQGPGRSDRGRGWKDDIWQDDEDDTDPPTDRGIAIIDFTI